MKKTHHPASGASVEVLRGLMKQHGLTQREVAEVAAVSPKTVEGWLADNSAASFRSMPPRHLAAIQMMLPGYLRARASRTAK